VAGENRSETLQANERIKHLAGAVTAWGNALLIASFGKWALVGFDVYVLLWLAASIALIWAASHALTMLEADHD
jgi:hypothetical protein